MAPDRADGATNGKMCMTWKKPEKTTQPVKAQQALVTVSSSALGAARQSGPMSGNANELDDKDELEEGGDGGQYEWDKAKGRLVVVAAVNKETILCDNHLSDDNMCGKNDTLKGTSDVEATEKPKGECEHQGENRGADEVGDQEGTADDDDSGDSEGEEEDGDVDNVSRLTFLNEASTPELINQAVCVGGALAASVTDRWVLDKTTQLYFNYEGSTQLMHCWNPSQGYMYLWKGRGKLEFVWAASENTGNGSAVALSVLPPGFVTPQASPPVATGMPPPLTPKIQNASQTSQEADAAEATATSVVHSEQFGADRDDPKHPDHTTSEAKALWVTVLPPSVLDQLGMHDPHAQLTEEVKVPSRALGDIIGKHNSTIRELETHSGAKLTVRPRGENEQAAHLIIEGNRDQIASAKQGVEQRLVMALGEKKMERLQKHENSEILQKKRTETGAEAAIGGVPGLAAFAEQWKLKAVLVRKLKKLDAMCQRYLIRHFKPWKAKPDNALRSYVTTLLMHPQRWRLHALYEEGELDGDVCETAVVNAEHGAIVGLERSAVQEILGDEAEAVAGDEHEQMIELEVDHSLGDRASRVFGDVQPRHCRLIGMGGDFYVMALESHIGTIIDGKKFRREDGPVAIRDGSTLAVGKYLVSCEVGTSSSLQDRRRRILAGENFWKILKGAKSDGNETASVGEIAEGASASAALADVRENVEEKEEDANAVENDDVAVRGDGGLPQGAREAGDCISVDSHAAKRRRVDVAEGTTEGTTDLVTNAVMGGLATAVAPEVTAATTEVTQGDCGMNTVP
eukprot:TRINITY_DN3044_c0_g4_i1.p1 TRINITY_DN3044_c0_g4~~TRINITY_DN3044_c0_g4_i1.p1  ORF type:complete len:874 (-),score=141.06 TRINITY_DN3044_c0_g4_i1:124-2520(-)